MNLVVFDNSAWGKPLPPDDPRSLHIRRVLKAGPGQVVRVALLNQGTGTALVRGAGEPHGSGPLDLQWPETLDAPPAPLPLRLILGQTRPLVMQRLFKDLASLGVAEIRVVAAELTEKSYNQASFWEKQEYHRFLLEGVSQGGLGIMPRVSRHWSVSQALQDLEGPGPRLLCHPGPWPPIIDEDPREPASTTLAIGPERGWTPRELALFQEAGFSLRSLGRAILRTELAASALAALWSMASPGAAP